MLDQKQDYELNDQDLEYFVDGMLDASHSEKVIRAMEHDAGVRDRIRELRHVKDLMRVGFGHDQAPDRHAGKTTFAMLGFLSPRIAASVAALAVTFAAGLLSQPYLQGKTGFFDQQLASSALLQADTGNVILHISQSDPQHFTAALAYAEKYLEEHREQGHQLDVVAHSSGLDMLRDDLSPHKLQMIEMLSKYDNVHFIGCANAIRVLRSKGIEPPIIQGVSTDSTAFDHIVSRLQGGGWKYIKIESLAGA